MNNVPETKTAGPALPAEDDEVRLAPIECTSYEEERREFLRRWAASAAPLSQPKRTFAWRFRLADLFWLMFAVALGCIGGGAVHGKLRATLLGLLLTSLIVLPIYVSLDQAAWRRIWVVVMVAYLVSVAVVFATSGV